MAIFIKKIIFPIFLFTAAFLIVMHFIGDTEVQNTYTLKAYKNTVALYNGVEIVNIYDNIVLNALPKKDIENFNKGISFATTTQAEIYLEDFD